MWSKQLISDSLKDDVQTIENLSKYDKTSKLVDEMYRILTDSDNSREQLKMFCSVLSEQGDTALDRIARLIENEL